MLNPTTGLWEIQPQWVVTAEKQTNKQTNKQQQQQKQQHSHRIVFRLFSVCVYTGCFTT
jgi:hypothetical protein